MSVLIYTENWDGKFKKSSFELVSYGYTIAQMLNAEAITLSIGDVANDELQRLANYGASKIFTVQNPAITCLDNQAYTQIIAEVASKIDAKVIVMGHNNTGKALAPRLAVRMKAGLGSGVVKLPNSIDPFVVTKKVFSGNALGLLELKGNVKVLTLFQNSFELIENPKAPVIESFNVHLDNAMVKTQVLDVSKQTGKIILTDAEIVVSGGRGMKGPENWGPIEELAGLLGAATACSRPVSDEGWRGHEEHTGQTGKIIAPNLYIACGISGAIQHLAGVSSSKVIVAINKDPEAPIFTAANYGIIGDAQKVLPELVEAVKAFKAEQ